MKPPISWKFWIMEALMLDELILLGMAFQAYWDYRESQQALRVFYKMSSHFFLVETYVEENHNFNLQFRS